MESFKKQDELVKKIEEMREQRKAKEKARLDKLRSLNMQKYNTDGKPASVFQNTQLSGGQRQPKNCNSMTDLRRKSMMPKPLPKSAPSNKTSYSHGTLTGCSPNNLPDSTTSDPINTLNVPVTSNDGRKYDPINSTNGNIHPNGSVKESNLKTQSKSTSNVSATNGSMGIPKRIQKQGITEPKAEKPKQVRQSIAAMSTQRKSIAAVPLKAQVFKKNIPETSIVTKKPLPPIPDKLESVARMSMKGARNTTNKDPPLSALKLVPKKTESKTPSKISVFERLYKPKNQTIKAPVSHRNETNLEQKNRFVTAYANSRRSLAPAAQAQEKSSKMRRSISAVHFKRIGKDELKNCHHRYSSFGEGLDKVDLMKINEDDPVAKAHVVSMVRSEKKKTVKFQTATPRADELERKLKSWLQKRGKNLDSFHHLRCFGVNRLAPSEKDVFDVEPYDDENKENIEVEDDGSVTDLLSDRVNDFEEMKMKWRRASCFNDSEVASECTEAADRSLVSTETPVIPIDELLLGALTDLSQLVRDGYDWEQCARWLRAIRHRSPQATEVAAYWECRAALEECRGNLPRSCLCWEEAIAKGTETSVVEASLDQLLDKFMRLNISPERARRPLDAREMLCAKNVFKSSLIRFAVQNAKAKNESAKYTVTPVRRSSRISVTPGGRPTPAPRTRISAARTPLLQLASSLKQIDEDIRNKSLFVPNKLLQYSP